MKFLIYTFLYLIYCTSIWNKIHFQNIVVPSLDDFEWQLEWAIIKDTQFRDWLISAFWWQLCMRQCDQINLNITDWYPSTYFENCKYQILFYNLAFIGFSLIQWRILNILIKWDWSFCLYLERKCKNEWFHSKVMTVYVVKVCLIVTSLINI